MAASVGSRSTSSTAHDSLLSHPDGSLSAPPPLPRRSAPFADVGQRFLIPREDSHTRQFSHTYFVRLLALRPHVEAAAQRAWPDAPIVPVLGVGEASEDGSPGRDCVIVGTLYKTMRNKPSILTEVADFDPSVKEEIAGLRFTADDDSLVLENEDARIMLSGADATLGAAGAGAGGAGPSVAAAGLPTQRLLTGVVVGVRGNVQADGSFLVRGIVYPGFAPMAALPLGCRPEAGGAAVAPEGSGAGAAPRAEPSAPAVPAAPPRRLPGDRYLAVVSGLDLASDRTDPLLTQLLVDYLTGALGGGAERDEVVGNIARVVVAGNAFGHVAPARPGAVLSGPPRVALEAARARRVDAALAELASAVGTTVLAGARDPCAAALPQRPLHPLLVPGAAAYRTTLRLTTNPAEELVEGVRVLATSGAAVEDGIRYRVAPDDPLDLLEDMLRWCHLAPTAPDTLASHPFQTLDPLVLDVTPHVFIAGDCARFETRLVRSTARDGSPVVSRLVAVPRFSATGQAVLINLRSLEAHALAFEA